MSEAVAPNTPEGQAGRPFLPETLPSARAGGLLRLWLLVIALMVYAMILVGGATRLTDSGLSITEWRPLLGAIPPMNDADWADAFQKYQTMTAQFHQVNPDMDMAGFQAIYWWEWWHRQLGRLIGVVFALPFIAFLAARVVPRWLFPHLVGLFVLGGLQGAIGWWMVASGVNTELVTVAPYRLMTHFGLALLIVGWCFWLWLELGPNGSRNRAAAPTPLKPAFGWASALLWLAGLQMLLGALVAGLDAGRGYTDWPLMAGRIVPEAMWALDPVWSNVFENEATAQFLHRITAYLLLALTAAAALKFRSVRGAGFRLLAALMLGQAVLGVVTLVHAAPLNLALLHQALGVITLLAAIRTFWATGWAAGRGAAIPG